MASDRHVGLPNREEWHEMTLDAEGVAIKQAKFETGNQRVVWAWIEFAKEGHAWITITISRELIDKASAIDSSGEVFAEVIRTVLPDAFNIEVLGKARRQTASAGDVSPRPRRRRRCTHRREPLRSSGRRVGRTIWGESRDGRGS